MNVHSRQESTGKPRQVLAEILQEDLKKQCSE